MTIIDLSKLKIGDSFKYHGVPAVVNYVRPKYPPEKTWVATPGKGNEGKWVMIPDKSVAIGFEAGGENIGLVSTLDSKEIIGDVFKVTDFSRFGYSK